MWNLIWHFGLSGGLVAGLLAAAYFSPVFKKDLVYGAIVVAVAMGVYALGVHDEKANRDAQQLREQAKIEQAVKDALAHPGKDPFDDPHN